MIYVFDMKVTKTHFECATDSEAVRRAKGFLKLHNIPDGMLIRGDNKFQKIVFRPYYE